MQFQFGLNRRSSLELSAGVRRRLYLRKVMRKAKTNRETLKLESWMEAGASPV